MNFAQEIDRLDQKVTTLRKQLADAETLTTKVLAAAEANGATRIGINKVDKTVHHTGEFPFTARGSIFVKGRDDGGWPVAWRIAKDAGISGGAGNTDQHQITDAARLIDGIYELVDGVWHLVEAKDGEQAA